jgi:cbb3-type cytochrome oxidase subunit 3
MSFNTYTSPGWWDRTRMMRYVFSAGLVIGLFAGWFFHGLISMLVQFGMVILLLLPLAVLGFMWWRSSRERNRMQSTMTVMRWGNGQFAPYGNDMAADRLGRMRYDREEVLDVDDTR